MAFAFRAPVDWDPLVGSAPDQLPEAVQEAASFDVQEITELDPLAMLLGPADIVTVGAMELTETVTDCVAVPPSPLQARLNVLLLVIGPVDWVPISAREPLHAPEDEQEVALLLVHDKVEVPPFATVGGLALNFTVGAAFDTLTVADWVAVPAGPLQVSSNSVVLVIAPVDAVP